MLSYSYIILYWAYWAFRSKKFFNHIWFDFMDTTTSISILKIKKYLGSSTWAFYNKRKFLVLNVLPFSLNSAFYVFTKLLRPFCQKMERRRYKKFYLYRRQHLQRRLSPDKFLSTQAKDPGGMSIFFIFNSIAL